MASLPLPRPTRNTVTLDFAREPKVTSEGTPDLQRFGGGHRDKQGGVLASLASGNQILERELAKQSFPSPAQGQRVGL